MPSYTYRAEWSPQYGEYEARCLEFSGWLKRGPTAAQAIETLEREITDEMADRIANGLKPPPSLTDRHYSGTFVVRASPDLHGRLSAEAAEQGVSLNQWAITKLAGRLPSLDDLF
ncbi:type II toxin-antitoxin system HicB family antitoxin [Mycolicibacterium litorale]|uniref:Antitoxin HicB n=1 Tax=Mycolicibacterium litorale TaxID=758802 RepID=A0AAD1IGY0_9MYCO|nr:type II toxin-antitoxin system HicB family antitoxin [Mycolicibacterium litorale]MCV7418728.1 type II toxin-antitoxin system HicB family antitoxin [Mycolicibacterium litorale]TDY05873.1 HicB-like protein involved in pilus formation [Mycolicibacterium litorale]BBY14621.1 antitoxin HicB [Mycolicibacterium litorale]